MKNELSTLRKVDNAINLIQSQYGQLNVSRLLIDIVTGRTIKNEKLKDLSKKLFENVNIEELKKEIAKNALKVASSSIEFPKRNYCDEFAISLKRNHVPYNKVLEYLNNDEKTLCELTVSFAEQRYNSDIDQAFFNKVDDDELRKYIYFLEPTNSMEAKKSHLGKIRNLFFNRSKFDVIDNAQFNKHHKDYRLSDDLFASTDMGKKQMTQEDAVLILEHPKNKKFKLLAVADGSSDNRCGDKASNYVLRSMLNWFEDLDLSYYENLDDLKELINNKLRQINVELLENKDGRSTTFTCAIVGKDKTLISSIGNSRAYIVKDNELKRVTRDDSYIQDLTDLGIIDSKISRFHKGAKIVNQTLGKIEHRDPINPQVKTILNDYDKVIIVTDGITKCVDEDEIAFLSTNMRSEEIAKVLVRASQETHSKLGEFKYGYNETINPGIENSTAAVYIKK